jgi:pimeloyl-ACP methyl ester carboxylesterase
MPSFHHGGVEISYLDEGEGDPIVLVHGFASSKNVNWVYPTWVSDLKKSGRRVIAFILGGIGLGLIKGGGPGENVAKALEADSLDEVTDPVGRTFRAFADQTRSDRKALAACLRGSRGLMTREQAAEIAVPVLIAVGTSDEIAGSAHALGEIIPGAEVLDIPNRDHMRAVGDKVYKAGVLDFLSRRP